MRAMSLRVLVNWLGSSSFSVTAWLRRSNRCFCCSASSCSRWLVSFSRISLIFMTTPTALSDRVTAMHEPGLDRHLMGDAGQGLLGRRLIDASDFEHDPAGLDDGAPVFRLALSLAHAGFQRFTGDGLVRENADEDPTLATQK